MFLSLYSFADEDIEQFRSLFVLSQQGEIDFLLTQQVVDEFWRNREAKINESLELLKNYGKIRIPALARDIPKATPVVETQKELSKHHKDLVADLLKRAADHELSADKLIKEIFEKSTVIPVSEEITERARERVFLGNPPGKNGSYGDAINWECIIERVEALDTLYFVSRDRDYASRLHDGEFNEFLQREISKDCIAEVSFFSSLKDFIQTKFPTVKIDAFLEASEAVAALEESGSFSSTHSAIFKLEKCGPLTTNQVKRLIRAAEDNPQVNWILMDDDVHGFFRRIQVEYSPFLLGGWKHRLSELVAEGAEPTASEVDVEETIPF